MDLLIGPFDALEKALAERLAAARADSPGRPAPATVVTPSWTLNRRLQSLLVRDHGLALAGTRFHTFQSLAREMVLDSGVPADALADGPLADEGIMDAILRSGPVGATFRRLLDTPGLLSALRGSLSDMEEGLVNSGRVREMMAADAGRRHGLADLLKLHDLLRERRRELGIISRAGVVQAAAGLAPESALAARLGRLHFYGAYDLTLHLVEFVSALAEGREATFYFPALSGGTEGFHPAYRFALDTHSRLVGKSAASAWIGGSQRGPLGERLAQVMGRDAGTPGPVPARVTLLEAAGPEEELDAIAVECLRLVREEGYRPGDIVVVTRTLEKFAPLAGGVFASRGIPWTSSYRTPLSALPVGEALEALITLLSGDFSPDPVVAAGTSRWLGCGGTAPSLAACSALAGRMWAGAGHADWGFLDRLKEDREVGADAAALGETVRRFGRLSGRFPPKGKWEEYIRLLQETVEECLERGMLDASPPSRELLAEFQSNVADLKWLGRVAGEHASAGEFWDAVERAFRETDAPIHERGGGVALLDAMAARGCRARALFLAGLNDGAFPRVAREDPFLRDADRALLTEGGFKVQLKGPEGAAEERLLFHLLLSQAGERLHLSWHANDADGRPAIPSGFLLDVAAALWPESDPAKALEDGRTRPATARSTEPVPAARPLMESALAHLRELDEPGEAGANDGIMGEPCLPARGLSVTRVRDAVSCPFKVHAREGLGLRVPGGPADPWSPSPLAAGTLLHKVLERVVQGARERWDAITPAGLSGSMRAILGEEMDATFPEYARVPVFRTALEEEFALMADRLLAGDLTWTRENGLRPAEFEQERKGDLPTAAGDLRLTGKFDRIDRGPGKTRVVDYKTHLGRSTYKPDARFTPEFMQLGLYRRLAGLSGEGLHLSVLHTVAGPDGFVPQMASGARAGELAAGAESLAALVGGMLMRGSVPPAPDDVTPVPGDWGPECRYCEFSVLCRKDHEPTRDRLEGEPGLRALAEEIRAVSERVKAAVPDAPGGGGTEAGAAPRPGPAPRPRGGRGRKR